MTEKDKTFKTVTFADTDLIEQYDYELFDILRRVFQLDPTETLVTDESWLCDFSTCCLPDDFNSDGMTLFELNATGNNMMIDLVRDLYSIDVKASDTMLSLCQKVRENNG
jgi:hypothetical protein